jgi:hypothetical protein
VAEYRERLLPRIWVWIALVGVVAMIAVAYGAALGDAMGWGVGIVGTGLVFLLLWTTAPRIHVGPTGLSAGRATLPPASIARVEAVSGDRIRELRGPGADARVFTAIRTLSARGGVLIELDDPADPHPAWLVSSRHPERLVAAVTATMAPTGPDRTDQENA